MGSRRTIPGVENVYVATEKWVDCALRKDDSLFTPGKPIWTRELLGELRECYLDRPDVPGDDFYDRLRNQLRGSRPEVHQLMAEVLYAQFLIIWKEGMGQEAKKNGVEQVLGWGAPIATISEDLIDGLTPGIAHSQALLQYRPYQVGFIIEFADQWKALEQNKRNRLLKDPWAFKNLVMGMKPDSLLLHESQNTPQAQREALLHLVHPDAFEGTVSVDHKKKIAEANAFAHFITEEIPDVDHKLVEIRRGLEAGLDRDFGFYEENIRSFWDTETSAPWWDPSTSNPWAKYLRIASDFLHSGRMWPWELENKYEIGRKLEEAMAPVRGGTDDWAIPVKRGLTGNLIFRIQQAKFREWINLSPKDALKALQTIWASENLSLSERIRAFSKLLPQEVIGGAGTRMNVISQLLMGLNVEKYPPFKTTAFSRAYKRTGYPQPSEDADEAELYEHALGFLDQFIIEARARGIPVRHRLDAQGLVWIIPHQEEANKGTDPTPDDEDLDELVEQLFLPVDFLENITGLLDDKKQVIFQGPPGTGKTYVAQRLANHLAGPEGRVTFVQFHPSYAYEDFVRGFRPKVSEDGQPGFELKDGPLLQAADRAAQEPDADHFLIIDEINRGNLASVFGELYFLLEYRDKAITLQYQRHEGEEFSLPDNLFIIGTMNTADRSIALIDLALRRRFYFVEFHPDDEPVKGALRRWLQARHQDMEWVADVVDAANELLKDDRHAAIGPSYFMKDGLSNEMVERIWKHSVLPYIEERRFGGDEVSDDFDLEKLKRSIKSGDGSEDGVEDAENEDGGPSDASN